MNITKACPDCGRPLVERTNRATGEPFLGCEATRAGANAL